MNFNLRMKSWRWILVTGAKNTERTQFICLYGRLPDIFICVHCFRVEYADFTPAFDPLQGEAGPPGPQGPAGPQGPPVRVPSRIDGVGLVWGGQRQEKLNWCFLSVPQGPPGVQGFPGEPGEFGQRVRTSFQVPAGTNLIANSSLSISSSLITETTILRK